MRQFVTRPSATYRPGSGLLRNDHFQVAYATNDIDRACDMFSNQLGIKEFRRLEGPMAAGGHARVELAWVGGTMYELIAASGPGSDIYVSRLPSGSFAIRHHHLGFLIHDEAQWHALESDAARIGKTLLEKSNSPGFLQKCFVDVPELGHYFEYIFPEQAGIDFFESVPGN
jgi:extradiol dioxygenase family protein